MSSLAAIKPAAALGVGFVALLANDASAEPIYFPASGSWYEVVLIGNAWTDANAAAATTSFLGTPGRLATVTSQEENDFLLNSVLPSEYYGFWIGGSQTQDAEPANGWEWITGEPWSFTNWDINEPNNAAPDEDFLQIYSQWTGAPVPERRLPGKWNDLQNDRITHSAGYVIEYAVVPEPGALALVLLGTALAFGRRARA